MLDAAFSFATEDDDLAETYLIGSGLLLGSFLVGVTAIPLYGYYLKVLDAGRTGSDELPEFDDWKELVVDGLKMLLVNLAYTGIPGILLGIIVAITVVGVMIGGAAEQGAIMFISIAIGGIFSLLALALLFVGAVMSPAALARMRESDDVHAAFEVRDVFAVAKRSEYLVAVVIAYVVGAVVATVGTLFAVVLIGLPILFFGVLLTFHLYGQGYARAVEAIEDEADVA